MLSTSSLLIICLEKVWRCVEENTWQCFWKEEITLRAENFHSQQLFGTEIRRLYLNIYHQQQLRCKVKLNIFQF